MLANSVVKRLVVLLLLLVLSVLALWQQRDRMVLAIANQQLEAHGLQLSCLNWSLQANSGLPNVIIEQACVITADVRLQLRDWKYQPANNALIGDSLTVIHTPLDSSQSSVLTQPLQWQLPANVPSLEIKAINVQSPLLTQAIALSLQWQNLQDIKLSGDIVASVSVNDDTVTADVAWQLADLNKFFDIDPVLKSGIESNLIFNGRHLETRHKLTINQTMTNMASCHLNLRSGGVVVADIDIINRNASIDLSGMPIDVNWQSKQCSALQGLQDISIGQTPLRGFNTVRIEKSRPISISEQELALTDVVLTLTEKENNPRGSAQLQLQAFKLLFESGQYHANLNMASDLQLQSQGALKWPITGNDGENGKQAKKTEANEIEVGETETMSVNSETTVSINNVKYQDVSVANVKADVAIKLATFLEASVVANLKNIAYQTMTAEKLQARISLNSDIEHNLDSLTIDTDLGIKNVKMADIAARKITQKLLIKSNSNQQKHSVKGVSSVVGLSAQAMEFMPIAISHKARLAKRKLSAMHDIAIEQAFNAHISNSFNNATLTIKQQEISALNSLLEQQQKDSEFVAGSVDVDFKIRLNDLYSKGSILLSDASIKYQDYSASGIKVSGDVVYRNEALSINQGKLDVNKVFAGIEIDDIKANVSENAPFKLSGINGQLLGGSFSIDHIALSDKPQTVTLLLEEIDASEILALEQQSGISFEAKLDGEFPVLISDGEIEIQDGTLKNVGDASLIINNNAAFDALKAEQAELGEVLSSLEALDISRLSAGVKLGKDGWVNLGFKINGRNQEKQQDVNFNYNHKENIYTLMKALRMGDVIKDQVEKELQ